jgi:heme-degrading monooxygenase HmoA
MAHARIAVFTFKPGSVNEVANKAEQEVLPMLQLRPGFITYTLVKTGDDTIVSFSMWETKRQAEEANRVTGEWVHKNLNRVLVSVDRYIGDVAFSFPPTSMDLPID